MAPPPPPTTTLSQRLLALAQTLQFAWFIGHVTLLLCTLRYALSYIMFNANSGWAVFSYRTAFVAAAATYGIVVYKAFRARARSGRAQGGFLPLAGDENVQYLAMALIWLITRQVPLAVLPFAIYSVFHVATYTRSNLLPTIQSAKPSASGAKPAPSGLSESIGRFVKEYYDTSMNLVAILEIGVWFRILLSAIVFTRGSWIQLVIYTVFLRVRHSQSSFVQNATSQLVARADGVFANQSMPPAVRGGWESAKGIVRQAADATDINKFRQPTGVPKKAQ